jgi:hypothetical protein
MITTIRSKTRNDVIMHLPPTQHILLLQRKRRVRISTELSTSVALTPDPVADLCETAWLTVLWMSIEMVFVVGHSAND